MLPGPKMVRGQQELTPEQAAYARKIARERMARVLSTAAIDAQEAERHLREASCAAGLEPPATIRWFDSPISFVRAGVGSMGASVKTSVWANIWASMWSRLGSAVGESAEDSTRGSVLDSVFANLRASVTASVGDNVEASRWASAGESVKEIVNMWPSVETSLRADIGASVLDSVRMIVRESAVDSVAERRWAYGANAGAFYQIFHEVFEENKLIHFACFEEMVSGYYLGREEAWLVHKPTSLHRDAQGRLHSVEGMCMQYRDGWGFYAWHGVHVPDQVILAPERLSREDFLNAGNVEVRRVIQERMGQRFVSELGGVVIDSGPRGTLYEVALPEVDPDDGSNNDPERVARYVQVQDASSQRRYFLRVPPTIQTAAEAVAWSFGLSIEEYGPAQET